MPQPAAKPLAIHHCDHSGTTCSQQCIKGLANFNLLIMDQPRNVIIVGGVDGEQGKLQTYLEPVKLSDNIGLAVTSIFHGEVFNISSSYNKVHFTTPTQEGSGYTAKNWTVEIPVGHYLSTFLILNAIHEEIEKDELGISNISSKPHFEVILTKGGTISVIDKNIVIDFTHNDTPWKVIGIESSKDFKKSIKNINYSQNLSPAFLYVNIIENSYINGHLSRILSMVPISMKSNWSYYEFAFPNYVPIDVKEFSKIDIEIKDFNGKLVEFNPEYKTIITLSLQAINTAP